MRRVKIAIKEMREGWMSEQKGIKKEKYNYNGWVVACIGWVDRRMKSGDG